MISAQEEAVVGSAESLVSKVMRNVTNESDTMSDTRNFSGSSGTRAGQIYRR